MNFLSSFAAIAAFFSGMSCAIGILIAILIFGMMTPAQLYPAEHEYGAMRFVAMHLRTFVVMYILYWATGLAASIGLLKRRRWAKTIWLGLLVVGLVWVLGAACLEIFLPAGYGGGAVAQAGFRPSALVIVFISALSTVVLGWLLKRLAREELGDHSRAGEQTSDP